MNPVPFRSVANGQAFGHEDARGKSRQRNAVDRANLDRRGRVTYFDDEEPPFSPISSSLAKALASARLPATKIRPSDAKTSKAYRSGSSTRRGRRRVEAFVAICQLPPRYVCGVSAEVTQVLAS